MVAALCTGSYPAWGQSLYDQALEQTPVFTGRADGTGVSVRGGFGYRSYLDPKTVHVLDARASIGGPCGSFDFQASMEQLIETIPELITGLIDGLIANIPMLALCYVSPSICDLAKHWQAYTNLLLQARFAQCNQMQTAMAAAGLKLRGGQAARCLEDQNQSGATLSDALNTCLADASNLRNPFGENASSVALIGESLEAAGASPFTIDLARNLIGEVTLSGGGSVLTAHATRPTNQLHRRYESIHEEVTEALEEAVAAVASGNPPSETIYRRISTPGQAMPQAVLEGLVTLHNSPVRFESLLHQLGAGLSITRLTWEVHELLTTLSTAGRTNPNLTDEERAQIEAAVASTQQELTRLKDEKETAERHLLPAIHAVLAEHAAVQQTAATAGFDAPSGTAPPTPFGGQIAMGYSY
jgi:hypothetical protein